MREDASYCNQNCPFLLNGKKCTLYDKTLTVENKHVRKTWLCFVSTRKHLASNISAIISGIIESQFQIKGMLSGCDPSSGPFSKELSTYAEFLEGMVELNSMYVNNLIDKETIAEYNDVISTETPIAEYPKDYTTDSPSSPEEPADDPVK